MIKNPLCQGFIAFCFLLTAAAHGQTGLTPNMIRDGGMETWNEILPEQSQYNNLKKLQVSFADTDEILMPTAYEQGGISVVQREEKDVYSGRYSLRLKASRFYMHSAYANAYYDVRQGDIYVVRFMAKGTGTPRAWLNVYRDRESLGTAYTIEQKGAPVADKWTMIEQRILVGQTSPTKVYPAIESASEMLIDDVFMGRVLRENEQSEAKRVPKEYDERIAFASPAAAAPVIDGKLDEECWNAAIAFSGFRISQEQTLLAPEQSSFRVLYDEKAIYIGMEIPLADARRLMEEMNSVILKDAAGNPRDKTADVYTDRHSIEVFIQPPGQSRYVQYVASLDGCRFDGTGLGKQASEWNGRWTCAVTGENDRWFLEIMVPAADLNLEKIGSTEGWRLNVVDNREGNYAIWAAVGNNFHTPFNFGSLVTKDFTQWRGERMQAWDIMRKKAADQDGMHGLNFTERLEKSGNFAGTLSEQKNGKTADWTTVTRTYALMNFVDSVYRSIDAEITYAGYFLKR